MAKKYKGKKAQPNAPDQQTILLESPIGQQPAHNPYYPDISQVSPPPYTDLSTEATRMADNTDPRYQRFSNPTPGQPTVIVQRIAASGRDFGYYSYCEKIRKFNRGMILFSVVAILLSYITLFLYSKRSCIDEFLIHQPTPETLVRVKDLKSFSYDVIGISLFLLGVSLIKSLIGYSKSSACFLLIVALASFAGTILTGYMAYLSFYSPCVVSVGEIVSKTAKTFAAGVASFINEKTSNPDQGIFGETNVIQYIDKDGLGVAIFGINVALCISFFSGFIDAITSC